MTHVFGRGLANERYVVERFQAMADGDIRRAPGDAAPAKGRRKAKRTIASLKAVRQLRPTRTEIIVCTGLRIKGGVQIWGDIATGLSPMIAEVPRPAPLRRTIRARQTCFCWLLGSATIARNR